MDDPAIVMTAPPVMTTAAADQAGDGADAEASPSRGMVSSMVSDSVSGVLPPALADFTVAPFILFELLAVTLFESVRQMLVPFILISLVMAVFVWSEHRRRPDAPIAT